jgi:hypothetical protein
MNRRLFLGGIRLAFKPVLLIIYVIMLSKTTLIISVVSLPIKISISVISYRVKPLVIITYTCFLWNSLCVLILCKYNGTHSN